MAKINYIANKGKKEAGSCASYNNVTKTEL